MPPMQDKFSHSAESALESAPARRRDARRGGPEVDEEEEEEEMVETACPSCSSLAPSILPLPLESAIERRERTLWLKSVQGASAHVRSERSSGRERVMQRAMRRERAIAKKARSLKTR